MTTLLWFKRDLRLADHPALHKALRSGAPLPVFILEPEYWRLDDTSGRQFAFLRESLIDLRRALRDCGSDLILRTGDAVEVLQALLAETGFDQIVSHEETGNDWTFARDRRVAAWARDRGIPWDEVPQSGVIRRLNTRDRWAAARNRFMAADPLPAPKALPPVRVDPGPIPTLDLRDDPCPGRQAGGRDRGVRLLDSFLATRGQDYRRAMSSPLDGAAACSRLSPHLALGTISVREVVQRTAQDQRARRGTRDGWLGSLKSFQSRLAWRDHFMQKLEDEPAIEFAPMHPGCRGLRPAVPDAEKVEAWQWGETGLPFLDACMRSLNATGWLNFRMRSMVMSVAAYHLWLDWRAPGLHLARMFTDYEPGIHWSQVQMQSGTTGINTPRIYNPIKQGHDQDPTGAFTRRWLPELAEVPDALLQEPWRWDGAGRLRYPAPIVDVPAAARAARDMIWSLRAEPAFRDASRRVIDKHASRKDSAGHFVNDRAPRKRRAKAPDTQLKLDL
ncbi:FAD-binding domain-containing protein [Thalassococcus sp. BH17M4-6]|uniref:FAD-binding domain-containing protein n=1 Tax=Thalassococcus sp. BH17M4-6 TaxID=3413148 RepID=UPI003BC8E038